MRWGIYGDTFNWDRVVLSDVHDVPTLLSHRLGAVGFYGFDFATEMKYYEWEMRSEAHAVKDIGSAIDCLVGLAILGFETKGDT
jgi:hypothetical protein